MPPRNLPSEVPRDGGSALYVLMVALLLAAAFSALAVSAPTVRATDGTVKEMTFLLHSVNETETAKPLPGGNSTLTYFDTTLDFNDENVSILVDGTEKRMKWFLSPALAGSFTVDRFTLRIWANSSTGASSSAQIEISLHEVTDAATVEIHRHNFGSQPFDVTPELKAWSSSFSDHTFAAGSSIEIRLKANPGTGNAILFHYDTPQVNSRLSLRSPDSVDVARVAVLDAEGNATLSLDPGATDKNVTFQANVTDPLGGYDIRWVNLTLISPFEVVLDNVSMPQVSGTPVSFESVYEYAWNYSDQPQGQWTVEVWALDNNGHNHYHFFQQFTYGPYPDTGNATFSLGGLPHYVNVRAVDAAGGVLSGATVVLTSGGFPLARNVTDATGLTNLSMTQDTYEFRVYWQGVQVAAQVEAIQGNVSADDPLVLVTRVYSPVLQAETAAGSPLPGATFLLGHPNGDTLSPRKTNASGQIALEQVPGGNYSLEVSWRGVPVFTGVLQVSADGTLSVPTAVYELEVTARSGADEPLAGVFVSVQDDTGLVFDAGVTDAQGRVTLLLPQGNYTVQARYVTTYLGTLYDSGPRTSRVDLSDSQSHTVTFADYPVSIPSTRYFLFGLVYLGTLVALLVALLRIRRRGRGPGPDSFDY